MGHSSRTGWNSMGHSSRTGWNNVWDMAVWVPERIIEACIKWGGIIHHLAVLVGDKKVSEVSGTT